MALEFAGTATRLVDKNIEAAAKAIGCAVASIRAVIDVESRGGFLVDRRPKILFERHYFSRLTKAAHNAAHPAIANKTPGGYKGGGAEFDRLAQAIRLNRDAALRSASWGMFQIMGDNHKTAGFTTVEAFVEAMVAGEAEHLAAFVSFVRKNGLDDELVRRDWAGFARGYNGPNFAINKYDTKLAAAFAIHSAGGARTDAPLPTLRMGDTGEEVKRVQTALRITPDGDFGPATKAAVIKLQKSKGLFADGIVGAQTWAALPGD